MSRRSLIALALLLAIPALPSQASPIEYDYTGVITSANPSLSEAPVGASFMGTFTYDPANPVGGLDVEGHSQYLFGKVAGIPDSRPDGSGLTLKIDGLTIINNPHGLRVSVDELQHAGQYGYRDSRGNPAGPYTHIGISNHNIDSGPHEVTLEFSNPRRAIYGSLAPPALLDLDDFAVGTLKVVDRSKAGNPTLYTGVIRMLTSHPVPEPTSLALFTALGAVLYARRRRPA